MRPARRSTVMGKMGTARSLAPSGWTGTREGGVCGGDEGEGEVRGGGGGKIGDGPSDVATGFGGAAPSHTWFQWRRGGPWDDRFNTADFTVAGQVAG